jgi:hypothetical protein
VSTDLGRDLRQAVLLNFICFGAGVLTGAGVGRTASADQLPTWMYWVTVVLLGLAAVALGILVMSAWRVVSAMEARYREEQRRREEGRGDGGRSS